MLVHPHKGGGGEVGGSRPACGPSGGTGHQARPAPLVHVMVKTARCRREGLGILWIPFVFTVKPFVFTVKYALPCRYQIGMVAVYPVMNANAPFASLLRNIRG